MGLFCHGVAAVQQLLQVFFGHMGVNLCGANVCMAQQKLNHPQIRPVVDQVGGKGMAQHVRADWAVNTRHQRKSLDVFPEALPGHRRAKVGDKQKVACSSLQQFTTGLLQIKLNGQPSWFAHGHQPFLVAFAQYFHRACVQVNGAQRHVDQFTDPQAAGIHEFKHGFVALTGRVADIGGGQQVQHLLFAQHFGYSQALFGAVKLLRGVVLALATGVQPQVKPLGAADFPVQAAGLEFNQVVHVVFQLLAVGAQQAFTHFLFQPFRQLFKVAAVGLQCGLRQTFFQPKVGREFIDQIGIAGHQGAGRV